MSEDDLSSPPNPLLVGLACRSNKTVSLLAMDSDQYGHFAAGLGIDLSGHKHRTAVIILNSEVSMFIHNYCVFLNYKFVFK